MKVSELKMKAAAMGVSKFQLEKADDSESVKETVISYFMAAEAEKVNAIATTSSVKETSEEERPGISLF